jgi:threonine dehydrogenase-like Zn-dependent dehydrogenase
MLDSTPLYHSAHHSIFLNTTLPSLDYRLNRDAHLNSPAANMVSTGDGSMKALRFHGQRDLRFEDIPVPEVGKGQVKIRPAWVGICGSDLHEYLGGPNLCPTTPHPITGETVPLTFGHEFSGTIEEVGEGVNDYKPGDRVAVQPIIYDGTCGSCEADLHNCCWSNGFVGLSGEQSR